MQNVDTKLIPGPQGHSGDRIRLVVSDGEFFLQAVLATQVNSKVHDGPNGIQKFSIVALKDYLSNNVQGRT